MSAIDIGVAIFTAAFVVGGLAASWYVEKVHKGEK